MSHLLNTDNKNDKVKNKLKQLDILCTIIYLNNIPIINCSDKIKFNIFNN